jgi:methylenetetrahydrofolate dehydrogenase (NADP+)/methenyltetrahydrofolate cyclohydrolase
MHITTLSKNTNTHDYTNAHTHWQVVADYNANPAVNGILVQLPLPKGIDEQRILDAIR